METTFLINDINVSDLEYALRFFKYSYEIFPSQIPHSFILKIYGKIYSHYQLSGILGGHVIKENYYEDKNY